MSSGSRKWPSTNPMALPTKLSTKDSAAMPARARNFGSTTGPPRQDGSRAQELRAEDDEQLGRLPLWRCRRRVHLDVGDAQAVPVPFEVGVMILLPPPG